MPSGSLRRGSLCAELGQIQVGQEVRNGLVSAIFEPGVDVVPISPGKVFLSPGRDAHEMPPIIWRDVKRIQVIRRHDHAADIYRRILRDIFDIDPVRGWRSCNDRFCLVIKAVPGFAAKIVNFV